MPYNGFKKLPLALYEKEKYKKIIEINNMTFNILKLGNKILINRYIEPIIKNNISIKYNSEYQFTIAGVYIKILNIINKINIYFI